MNIAMDLDSTLLDTSFLFKAVFEKHNLTYLPPVTYDMFNFPKIVKNEFYDIFNNDSYEMYKLPTYEGTIEKLKEWKKRHNLCIITARHNVVKTQQFVKALLGIDNCYVIGSEKKADYIKRLNIDVWIDDKIQDLLDIAELGKRCIMISNEDTVYNHAYRSMFEHHESIKTINI